jgi:hypothetical protein
MYISVLEIAISIAVKKWDVGNASTNDPEPDPHFFFA